MCFCIIKWKSRDLFISILLSLLFFVDCVLSEDVVLLKETVNGDGFADFVQKYAYQMPDNQENLFPESTDRKKIWQMRGYATFVKEGQTGQPVNIYAAKKRLKATNICNNPDASLNYINLFNYDMSMHTERQLIIAALEHQIQEAEIENGENANDILTDNKIIKGGMKINKSINKSKLNEIKNLKGNLYIFTYAPPCVYPSSGNGQFSCVNYYDALATCAPEIKLDIYFLVNRDTRLDAKFALGKHGGDAIQVLAECIKSLIQEKTVIIDGFRVSDDALQEEREKNEWINVVSDDVQKKANEGRFKSLIEKVNGCLHGFTNKQIGNIWETILSSITDNKDKIKYHAIQPQEN